MIDLRHGYAIARKIGDEYCIITSKRPHSTIIVLQAEPEPIRRFKEELEVDGATGLIMVRIIDNMIVEMPQEERRRQGEHSQEERVKDHNQGDSDNISPPVGHKA